MGIKPPKVAIIVTISSFMIVLLFFTMIFYYSISEKAAKTKVPITRRAPCGNTLSPDDYAKIAAGEPIPCLWTKPASTP